MINSNDCLFCSFYKESSNHATKAWYNQPVLRTGEFMAVPALGQIVPGYLLVIPRRHVYSIAQLNPGELYAFRKFCDTVAEIQAKSWDWPVIFEHGSCREDQAAGACIAHAHWHLVPGNFSLLPDNFPKKVLESFETFAALGGKSRAYLFFEDQSRHAYILDGIDVPSQFCRRELARLVGKADEWDYAVFPFYNNIRETYESFARNANNA